MNEFQNKQVYIKMNDYKKYISSNPNIRFGKPCIIQTRIAVYDVLSWLAAGMSHQKILEDYPYLKEEHIYACLAFAVDVVKGIK